MLGALKQKSEVLKKETYALYLAYRDPRVPWYAKAMAAATVAYAVSPIDVIPDFIPVLGYLDDMVLVPLGIAFSIKLMPPGVMSECWDKAQQNMNGSSTLGRRAAIIVVLIWSLIIAIAAWIIFNLINKR